MQQINLYLPEFRPNRELISIENLLACAVILLVILIGIYLSKSTKIEDIQQKINLLTDEQRALEEKLNSLKKKPAATKSTEIELELTQVREAIRNREAIAKWIEGQSFGNHAGFSDSLIGLGRNKIDGLVLNAFSFEDGGRFVKLRGRSTTAELVPLYLGKLQADPGFSGAKFGALTIERDLNGAVFYLEGSEAAQDAKKNTKSGVKKASNTAWEDH
jgi:cell division protein FtsB